jgi:hypothetical protein
MLKGRRKNTKCSFLALPLLQKAQLSSNHSVLEKTQGLSLFYHCPVSTDFCWGHENNHSSPLPSCTQEATVIFSPPSFLRKTFHFFHPQDLNYMVHLYWVVLSLGSWHSWEITGMKINRVFAQHSPIFWEPHFLGRAPPPPPTLDSCQWVPDQAKAARVHMNIFQIKMGSRAPVP